jgi:hypothetical protein
VPVAPTEATGACNARASAVKTIKLKFCELDWIDGFGAKTRFP